MKSEKQIRMHIFGITGGVGSGKSKVMEYLESAWQAKVVLMDTVGHELMAKGGACYEDILALFGPEFLLENGEFNRPAIAAKVFKEHEVLEKLNAIVHPAVKKEVFARIDSAKEAGIEFFFMESALLFEEKYDESCEELWFVYADEAVRRERLKASRNYSDEKIDSMLKNQMSEEEFQSHASFVINNSGDFAETEKQIDKRMREILCK